MAVAIREATSGDTILNSKDGQLAAFTVLRRNLSTLLNQPHKIFIDRKTGQAPLATEVGRYGE